MARRINWNWPRLQRLCFFPADRDKLIQRLRKDLSLRFNEAGRLLDVQIVLPEKRRTLADHVPAH